MGSNRSTATAKARKKRRIKNDRIIAANAQKRAASGETKAPAETKK